MKRHKSFNFWHITPHREHRLCYRADHGPFEKPRVSIAPENPLQDDANWIEIFHKHPEVLVDQTFDNDDLGGWVDGKMGEISSEIQDKIEDMTLEEREDVYLRLATEIIPAAVLDEYFGINQDLDSSTKRSILIDKKDAIVAILSAMHGMEDYAAGHREDMEMITNAARDALREHYELAEERPVGDERRPDSRALYDDFTDMLQELPAESKTKTALRDPAALSQRIKPSLLRGAMQMGVVTKEDIVDMHGGLQELEAALAESKTNVRRELDDLMGESKERIKNETNSLTDTWRGMGGGEKLLVLGALAGLLLWEKTRGKVIGAAGIFTGVYVFQKFILKQDDPIQSWSNLINGATENAKGNIAVVAPSVSPGYVEQSVDRAETMVDFLDDYNIEYLERQAIGFGILFDVPMNTLARNFDAAGGMHLNVNDPALRGQLEASLESHGWSSTRYRAFFSDNKNVDEVSNAIGYAFFLKAIGEEQYKYDGSVIGRAMGVLPAGTGISALGDNLDQYMSILTNPEERDVLREAHKEYMRLVVIGQNLAAKDTDTLGTFVKGVSTATLVEAGVYDRDDADVVNIPPAGVDAADVPSTGADASLIPSTGTASGTSPSTGVEPGISAPLGSNPTEAPPLGTTPINVPQPGTSAIEEPSTGNAPSSIPDEGSGRPDIGPI